MFATWQYGDGILMATIEEMAKRIDYLESVVEEQRARIAELERELTSWPIEYEDDVSKKLFSDSV
jgi:predicted RNase H-like nuclease (RuvC/YqgF family)